MSDLLQNGYFTEVHPVQTGGSHVRRRQPPNPPLLPSIKLRNYLKKNIDSNELKYMLERRKHIEEQVYHIAGGTKGQEDENLDMEYISSLVNDCHRNFDRGQMQRISPEALMFAGMALQTVLEGTDLLNKLSILPIDIDCKQRKVLCIACTCLGTSLYQNTDYKDHFATNFRIMKHVLDEYIMKALTYLVRKGFSATPRLHSLFHYVLDRYKEMKDQEIEDADSKIDVFYKHAQMIAIYIAYSKERVFISQPEFVHTVVACTISDLELDPTQYWVFEDDYVEFPKQYTKAKRNENFKVEPTYLSGPFQYENRA